MKNIFKLFAIVAMGIFATSCANDLTDDLQVNGGEVEVSFTTGLPSRAISDGSQATKLYVQAYAVQGTNLMKAASAEDVVVDLKATVNLRFVQGMTYKVVFWAQADGAYAPVWGDNGATVAMNYGAANAESRDAFYAVEEITVNGPATRDVKLYRPFAQLNVATNDLAEAQTLGFKLAGVEVVTKAYTTLDLISGEASGEADVVFTYTTDNGSLPTSEKLNGNDWLSYNYLLVKSDDQTLDEVNVTITQQYGNDREITEYHVPVKRNYRTNLVGALLTTQNGFNVELVPAIADIPGYPTAKDQFVSVATNGGTLTLTEDVVLDAPLNVASNFILDLNGHEVSYTADTAAHSSMITVKSGIDFIVKDSAGTGKIVYNYTGAGDPNFGWGTYTLSNYGGELVIDGGTIEMNCDLNATESKHMYCAVYQYSGSTTINGGTISTPTYRSARLWSGEMTINGGEFVGRVWVQAVNNNGVLNINGGSFTPKDGDDNSVYLTNGSYDINLNVTGGTFTKALYCADYTKAGVVGSVSGGVFGVEPNAGLIADGYAAAANADGTWTVGLASAAAFEDALNDPTISVVTLGAEIESIGNAFEIRRDVVLNMNNMKLNAGSTATSKNYALELYGDIEVEINDANLTRSGITVEEGADLIFNSGVIDNKPERSSRYIFCAWDAGTIVTINDGTFINDRPKNSYLWADAGGIIYVNGGTFTGVKSNNNIIVTNGAQVIISGGTFNFDPTTWVASGHTAVDNGDGTWTVQ